MGVETGKSSVSAELGPLKLLSIESRNESKVRHIRSLVARMGKAESPRMPLQKSFRASMSIRKGQGWTKKVAKAASEHPGEKFWWNVASLRHKSAVVAEIAMKNPMSMSSVARLCRPQLIHAERHGHIQMLNTRWQPIQT